jgi:hypothetical protein
MIQALEEQQQYPATNALSFEERIALIVGRTEIRKVLGNSRQINRKNAAAAWHITDTHHAVVGLNAAPADIKPQSESRPV